MILFIYGPDTWRSRQYLDKIVTKFKADRDPAGYNVIIVDAEDAVSAQGLMPELFAAPFLAEKRMVVVKNLLSSKSPETREGITGIIKNNRLPDSTVAVFWERADEFKGKDAKALFELLQKEKYKEHFAALEPTEAASWFRGQVEAHGATLARGVAETAVKLVGVDSFVLQNLADQLVNYRPDKEITMNDLNEFVEEKADENIFNLVDAIVAGRVQPALAMMRQQYRIGEDDHFILGMLIRQFRIMLQIADVLAQNSTTPPDLLAKQLGLHPFVVKKTIPLVKKFSLSELKHRFSQLADFDLKTKTGQGDLTTLLDILVVEMRNDVRS